MSIRLLTGSALALTVLGALGSTAPTSAVAAEASSHDTDVAWSGPALCLGRQVTVLGTPGDDRLRGTDGDDVIAGLGGHDVMTGDGGNDRICGTDGRDQLLGGPGNDLLSGGEGDDFIEGGTGADQLYGDGGRDAASYHHHVGGVSAVINGQPVSGNATDGPLGARDRIGTSIENLYGGEGNDTLTGSEHANVLIGRWGADRFYGLGGSDRIIAVDSTADVVLNCGTGTDPAPSVDSIDPAPISCP